MTKRKKNTDIKNFTVVIYRTAHMIEPNKKERYGYF